MDNNQRAVQLKTSVMLEDKAANQAARKELAHLNFLPMGELNPTAADYGVKDEQDKGSLNHFLAYMKSIDEQFFTWLEADAKNAILFANDPLKALKTAIPDFDESVLKNLNPGILK